MIDVSILIRTKNEAACIGDTLRRISQQRFSGTFEIIVVDSGSNDGTMEIARDYGVHLLQMDPAQFSYGRALNVGTEAAKGRFVANLSAHAKPMDERWLEYLISGFAPKQVAGTYGRQVAIGTVNPFEAYKNEQFFGEEKLCFHAGSGKELKSLHFSNGNSAIRKRVWERFRFNEKVGWAEDILWQNEVMRSGHAIVYVPEAAVDHTHNVDFRRAYSSSKDCALALAFMDGENKSAGSVLFDCALFAALWPKAAVENLWYVWRKRYVSHLKTTPVYILSAWIGWLVGRLQYRLRN